MQKYKDELKKKKKSKFLIRLIFSFVAGVFVILGIVYWMFFSGALNIRTIEINVSSELRSSVNDVVNDWLNRGFWRFIRRNNILFVFGNDLAAELKSKFLKLESIRVDKKFPHSLIISITERKSVGIVCSTMSGACFNFDKDGVAFSVTQSSSGFLILNITDRRNVELGLGKIVIASDWLVNIITARELLTKSEIGIAEFVIPEDSLDEFYAVTADGWRIMFNNQTDIKSQISALEVFLKEKISVAQRSQLQYIDLRIQDRIYYK
ncbi:MAG: hypothetical protein AAB784_01675 [Patescibacteria group bacterium]